MTRAAREQRETERLRLLARRSEVGYVDRYALALSQEPEAVPPDYQRQLTRQAHRRAEDRQRDAWQEASTTIASALARLSSARLDPKITSTVRVIERARARIDQEVGL
jgi:hypothetical protein